jgi:hypothetical protein
MRSATRLASLGAVAILLALGACSDEGKQAESNAATPPATEAAAPASTPASGGKGCRTGGTMYKTGDRSCFLTAWHVCQPNGEWAGTNEACVQ